MSEPSVLEIRLGYVFKNRALLEDALTHASFANENEHTQRDYERLEFLGDAVLDMLTAEALYTTFPEAKEGELSRRRARMVRWESLAVLAQHIDLSLHMRFGEGQRKAALGISKRIVADCYEALVGAVFLDGGYSAVWQAFGGVFKEALVHSDDPMDYKTDLQEACHHFGMVSPQYVVVCVEGPDHARVFTCEVVVGGEVFGRGTGTSKKNAEQICAQQALDRLQQERPSAVFWAHKG
jgi:ribonuclease-3